MKIDFFNKSKLEVNVIRVTVQSFLQEDSSLALETGYHGNKHTNNDTVILPDIMYTVRGGDDTVWPQGTKGGSALIIFIPFPDEIS